jgi:3'(2'), 5'-bisphosphate nucleotidase
MTRIEELEAMLQIAREASALVARVYATDFAVDYKRPADPVTEADRQANALICSRLAMVFGPVPVVAEESPEGSFDRFWRAPRVFFVDPLDGTRDFVARNGEFVVMIGLAEQGRAISGVVHAPATGTAWIGAVGLGAWEIADGGGPKTPIRVSPERDLREARAVVSRTRRDPDLERALRALGVERISARGSAGLKAADVAVGRADLYIQTGCAGQLWDACAPEAIVRAAGGQCSDLLGNAIDYSQPELGNARGLLMTNSGLHGPVLERLVPLLTQRYSQA